MATDASFTGFHPDAFRFFAELSLDNSKAFWEANKQRYLEHVRTPLEALGRELESAFGDWHVFRPYRDLRFSRDKRPYKDHAGLQLGGRGPSAVGTRYLQVDADGVFIGAGAYHLSDEHVRRFRHAVADERHGRELEEVVADLAAKGLTIEGPALVRAPRGLPGDHPRIALLKRKGLFASVRHSPAEWMYGPEAVDRVIQVFADGEALCAWFRAHVA